MKRLLVAAIIILGLHTADSFAQWLQVGKDPRAKERRVEFFSPQAAETVVGRVISTERSIQRDGKSHIVRMTVRSDSKGEIFAIYFCPGWNFERHRMKIEPNDRVLIKGSKMMRKGAPAIIASEVTAYKVD